MKTSFKIIKNLFLGLALLAFFLTANQAYALGSTPVKVVNPDEIAEKVAKAQGIQHPFQTTIYCNPISSGQCRGVYTVPENQRLVIEFISLRIGLMVGIPLRSADITTEVAGNQSLYFVLNYNANLVSSNITGSQMTRIYADPGTQVVVSANSAGNVPPSAIYEISGQLIDVP